MLRESILTSASQVLERRKPILEKIAQDASFKEVGGIIYPYDTIGANLEHVLAFFEGGLPPETLVPGSRIVDIGCANGELSLVMRLFGFDVTAIDYSFKHDRAPYVCSEFARELGLEIAVADLNVDTHFGLNEIQKALVSCSPTTNADTPIPNYDVAICLGLLYHLKNPFAFLESLSTLARYAIVGTHIATHTPDLRIGFGSYPLTYLLEEYELNSDPTNFWIFSDISFDRLCKRTGFTIVDKLVISNNELNIAAPDRTDLGIRTFRLLKSNQIS